MKNKFVLILLLMGLGIAAIGQENPDAIKEISELPIFPGCEKLEKKYKKNPTQKNKEKLEQCSQKNILQFIYSKLRYPKESKSNGIQGDVSLRFLIDKEGKVSNIEVMEGINEELDKEAVRVISLLPSFTPAKDEDGTPVDIYWNMDIKFRQ